MLRLKTGALEVVEALGPCPSFSSSSFCHDDYGHHLHDATQKLGIAVDWDHCIYADKKERKKCVQ